MNAMLCKIQIIFAIAAVHYDLLRGYSRLLYDQVPVKNDTGSIPVYCHARLFKHC